MVRQGGSAEYSFDVVGQMQAAKLISDAEEMSPRWFKPSSWTLFDGIKGSLDGIFDSVVRQLKLLVNLPWLLVNLKSFSVSSLTLMALN